MRASEGELIQALDRLEACLIDGQPLARYIQASAYNAEVYRWYLVSVLCGTEHSCCNCRLCIMAV